VPRVTVIIATYNWSSVLPWSIGSVLRQGFADFELLVVGDGCTDDSAEVVQRSGDARVRWINLPQNTRHQSGPNNEGLRQARGEFIAYLGHDDLWLPHHLQVMVDALDASGADFAHSVGLNVEPDGSHWPGLPHPAARLYSAPLCMVHRRAATEAIGGWREHRDLRAPPDTELWSRAADAGYGFEFVPRLTAIKFPAARRRGVYAQRPCHEQAAWTARIEREPALETTLLVEQLRSPASLNAVGYRELVRHFARQTLRRLRGRLHQWRRRWLSPAGADVDHTRRTKGLPE
jgi:glycosyltransferase involved in cell wall biosynthesis